ncbi:hypothetical protein D3C75_878030 [compost metagenome]
MVKQPDTFSFDCFTDRTTSKSLLLLSSQRLKADIVDDVIRAQYQIGIALCNDIEGHQKQNSSIQFISADVENQLHVLLAGHHAFGATLAVYAIRFVDCVYCMAKVDGVIAVPTVFEALFQFFVWSVRHTQHHICDSFPFSYVTFLEYNGFQVSVYFWEPVELTTDNCWHRAKCFDVVEE